MARNNHGNEQTLWFFELAPRTLRLQNAALKSLNPVVNFRQFRILARINGDDETLMQLSARGTLSVSSLSLSIDSLVEKGLIAKSRSPADGRVTILSITGPGKRLVQAGNELLLNLAEEVLQDIPRARKEQFRMDVSAVGDRVTQALRSLQNRGD